MTSYNRTNALIVPASLRIMFATAMGGPHLDTDIQPACLIFCYQPIYLFLSTPLYHHGQFAFETLETRKKKPHNKPPVFRNPMVWGPYYSTVTEWNETAIYNLTNHGYPLVN